MEENNEFIKQFGGSATANLLTAIVFMIFKFVQGRCKHSQCSSNTSCFKCTADNYATERASSPPNLKDDVQPEKSLQEMHTRHDREVLPRRSSPIKVSEPESREDTRDFSVVKGPELV